MGVNLENHFVIVFVVDSGFEELLFYKFDEFLVQ